MPSSSYDLVVLGDELASLVCAALCARRGLRTIVIGDDRPARYNLGPHKLPVDPMLWPQPLAPGDRVLKELHAELAMRRKLREPRIAAQLVTPELRIDLGSDRIATELEREVGKAAGAAWLQRWDAGAELSRQLDAILGGDHAFPGVGFFERREVGKLAEQVATESAAWWTAAAPDPHAPLWRHLAAIAARHPSPPPAVIARTIDAWRDGPAALRGDGDALRELLLEKLTTAGGEVRVGRITGIDVSWGKITRLELASGDTLGAAQVVTSRPPAALVEVLGKKAPKRLVELAETTRLVGYRYSLNIVLDEGGLPEHMAPTVAVIAAPSRDPVGDAAFSIHLGEPDETGRVIATVATVMATDAAVEPERLVSRCMALRAGLWKQLGDVMPFFERHLVLAHSPFEATPPQVPGGRGSYDVPRNLPLAMTPVWAGAGGPADAGSVIEQLAGNDVGYTTGLKNLTLTGEQVLPALGLDGALTSGWSAAKVACAIAGKKKDYLRDEVVGSTG